MLPLIREVANHSPYLVSEEHGMKKLTSVANENVFLYMLAEDKPLHPFDSEKWLVQFTSGNVSDELVQGRSDVRAARSGYRLQTDMQS